EAPWLLEALLSDEAKLVDEMSSSNSQSNSKSLIEDFLAMLRINLDLSPKMVDRKSKEEQLEGRLGTAGQGTESGDNSRRNDEDNGKKW
ncbi:hypothetical protein Ancab_039471, partial [Ancistrocladus abbreviatus]